MSTIPDSIVKKVGRGDGRSVIPEKGKKKGIAAPFGSEEKGERRGRGESKDSTS